MICFRVGPQHHGGLAKSSRDLISSLQPPTPQKLPVLSSQYPGACAAKQNPDCPFPDYHEMSTFTARSAFSASSLLRRNAAAPWTCRSCFQSQQIQQQARLRFSTSQHAYTQAGKRAWREKMKNPRERRKVAIAATVVFLAGAGALAFSEQARHFYTACERSGRVGVTLALCVNE